MRGGSVMSSPNCTLFSTTRSPDGWQHVTVGVDEIVPLATPRSPVHNFHGRQAVLGLGEAQPFELLLQLIQTQRQPAGKRLVALGAPSSA